MKILSLTTDNQSEILEAIKSGKIIIYPTDTIYGIGCNALNENSVKKIREIKKRDEGKPFSVIAPNIKWIKENCIVKHSEFLEKLPGPFTFIFLKKNPKQFSSTSSGETIGVRIPLHPFSKLIEKVNVPFVTTSVNVSGQPNATSLKNIPKNILEKVDIVIDAGDLNNPPSTIYNLTGDSPIQIARK